MQSETSGTTYVCNLCEADHYKGEMAQVRGHIQSKISGRHEGIGYTDAERFMIPLDEADHIDVDDVDQDDVDDDGNSGSPEPSDPPVSDQEPESDETGVSCPRAGCDEAEHVDDLIDSEEFGIVELDENDKFCSEHGLVIEADGRVFK